MSHPCPVIPSLRLRETISFTLLLLYLCRDGRTVIFFVCFQGDVWICMELMDTSLDKFYKKVIEKGKTIPEDILGKITVAVSAVIDLMQFVAMS